MGPRQQVWVSWLAGALLIANMRPHLASSGYGLFFFWSTQMTKKNTPTQIRNAKGKNGQGKTISLYLTAMLGATPQKTGAGKEC